MELKEWEAGWSRWFTILLFQMILMKSYRIKANLAFALLFVILLFATLEVAERPFLRVLGSVTGLLAYYFLIAVLMMGPLVLHNPKLGRILIYRRDVGLWAFYMAILHFLSSYIQIFKTDVDMMLSAGLAPVFALIAFIALIPPAATSFDIAVKKLGAKNWKRIQRISYAAAVLVVFHVAIVIGEYRTTYRFFIPGHEFRGLLDAILIYLPLAAMLILQISGFMKKRALSKK